MHGGWLIALCQCSPSELLAALAEEPWEAEVLIVLLGSKGSQDTAVLKARAHSCGPVLTLQHTSTGIPPALKLYS